MTPDSPVSAADLRFRLGALWVFAALLALAAVRQMFVVVAVQPLGFDFLPLWTGARDILAHHADLYDFAAVSARQAWLLGPETGVRPFVYPPSALLLLAPFGLLPFWAAYGLWTITTAGLFAAIIARLSPGPKSLAALLALVLSPCAMVLVVGQTTFLIGAMAILGILLLKRRPLLAGVLLGLAAAIKPQLLVMAPLALLAGAHYRALIAAVVAGAAAGLLAILLFGPQLWLDWLAALPRFGALVRDNPSLLSGDITPSGLAGRIGLDGAALTAWRALFVLAGAALAILTFRRTEDPTLRLAAMLGGALLASPYAIFYEAALLAPVAIWRVLDGVRRANWLPSFCGLLLLCGATFPGMGAPSLIAFLAVTLAPTVLPARRFSIS